MSTFTMNILKTCILFLIIMIVKCPISSNSDNNKARKLEYEDYNQLKIYIDLYNFNNTFPNESLGIESKDKIIDAIYKAKEIIIDLFRMIIYTSSIYFSNDWLDEWGLTYWNTEIFEKEGESFVELDIYNFFIFFKFSSTIRGDASSKIVLSTTNPEAGVITINDHMEQSKLNNKDYLTNLMLHQFIHLLGFHISDDYSEFDSLIVEETDDDGKTHYYITKENNPSVLNYAYKYFDCHDE